MFLAIKKSASKFNIQQMKVVSQYVNLILNHHAAWTLQVNSLTFRPSFQIRSFRVYLRKHLGLLAIAPDERLPRFVCNPSNIVSFWWMRQRPSSIGIGVLILIMQRELLLLWKHKTYPYRSEQRWAWGSLSIIACAVFGAGSKENASKFR